MQQAIVTDVNTEDVGALWPLVRVHLQKALDRAQGEFTLEDILHGLRANEMRLWIAYTPEGQVLASAVCELRVYPRKRVCFIILTGGSIIDYWSQAMDSLEDWASANGANTVAAYVREGFVKLLAPKGFKKVYAVVQKELP